MDHISPWLLSSLSTPGHSPSVGPDPRAPWLASAIWLVSAAPFVFKNFHDSRQILVYKFSLSRGRSSGPRKSSLFSLWNLALANNAALYWKRQEKMGFCLWHCDQLKDNTFLQLLVICDHELLLDLGWGAHLGGQCMVVSCKEMGGHSGFWGWVWVNPSVWGWFESTETRAGHWANLAETGGRISVSFFWSSHQQSTWHHGELKRTWRISHLSGSSLRIEFFSLGGVDLRGWAFCGWGCAVHWRMIGVSIVLPRRARSIFSPLQPSKWLQTLPYFSAVWVDVLLMNIHSFLFGGRTRWYLGTTPALHSGITLDRLKGQYGMPRIELWWSVGRVSILLYYYFSLIAAAMRYTR